MRFLVALLLLIGINTGVLGGLGEKIKNTFTGEGSIGAKIKNMVVKSFSKIREKLGNKIKKALELTPKALASLKERLSKWRKIKQTQVKETGDSINEINEKNNVTDSLYQGDIMLTERQLKQVEQDIEEFVGNPRIKRQAFSDKNYPKTIWTKGVFYYFDGASEMARVLISLWLFCPRLFLHQVRKLEAFSKKVLANGRKTLASKLFIYRNIIAATDKIRVFPGQGCGSFVGLIGGTQLLSLGPGCESVGTAAHEIGHALGLFHTMSRHDRDQFITINQANVKWDTKAVKPNWMDQFVKEPPTRNENYGITYDFGSVMNYGCTSASFNKKPTMVPVDIMHQETLGSPFVSFYDLLMLNTHYNCFDQIAKRPNGNRIQARTSLWVEQSRPVNSVEPFLTTHPMNTSAAPILRFCAYEDQDVTLLSHSNRVPVMIYSRMGQTEITIQYRYGDRNYYRLVMFLHHDCIEKLCCSD
ncbi:astacin [Ancylostoma caninum]|uniref:Metalloendopeptidase n=1 Tax=Ancylostoma caninum TaxID=29170 RepID=A0A368F6K6_ANCCA|nr:astacin [Ancylostoma caninum]